MSPDWQQTTLGEVVSFKGGGTPSTEMAAYWNGDIPWVSPKDMKSSEVGDSIDKITPEAIENSAASLIPKDAILIVVRSGILARTIPVAITTRPLAVNQDIKALCPNGDVDPRYLHYFMQMSEPDILKLVTRGATVHRLSTDSLKTLKFAKPPLAEQQRIVAILDEAFAGLATATANAEKNLKNARELFESYLQAIFTRRDADWEPHSLDEVCSFTSGGTPSKARVSYWSGDIPWVSGRDMKSDRIGDAALHISQEAIEGSASRIAPIGSLLVLVRGMGLANGIALAEVTSPCAFNQDIKAIHPSSSIHPRFLLHSLRAAFARSEKLLSNAAHGTLKVEMDELRKVPLRIPPLRVQVSVSSKIDSLALDSQKLARLYRKKIDALQNLKQSLLQKAFSGELTSPPSQAIKEAAE